MDWTRFLSAGGFAVAMPATPGPNNTMVVASGATYGFARTVPHMLGIAAGFPVMLVVLGTAGLPLLTDPWVRAGPKWWGRPTCSGSPGRSRGPIPIQPTPP
ncbi:hypothetical protein [Methylobacterium sp. 17Sr1-1]|uniref:LysE family translocator n=1 Tax=Methylobacterium sp. 17Sr1-1 TaxID=2202826 RepID=UPI001951A49B|nr:hypothetical protein [Methylobacterium sp. 17Sr1-1]